MNILHKVTRSTLWKNKTRTLVTIIGVILSAAMLTAVTTFLSSLQNYMLESVKATEGSWHGMAYQVPAETLQELQSHPQADQVTGYQNIGFALLPESQNQDKPYLFVAGMRSDLLDLLPISLLEGRMPENGSEIVLPDHLRTNGGVKYALGDVLTLEIGERVSAESASLGQDSPYLTDEDDAVLEQLEVRETRTYTVVGFCERPRFEAYSAAGYTAVTVEDAEPGAHASYTCYYTLHRMKDIYSFEKQELSAYHSAGNSDLLRYSGVSSNSSFYRVLYGLASILIVLIVAGSVSLIYNAFSISVSERTKQFGLLSSVGATKKQIRGSVLYEAFLVSVIGIPLGILSGMAGIGITFWCVGDLFTSLWGTQVTIHLSVSPLSLVAAALIALATVLFSAYLPARKAVKLTAIEAIRQTKDIKIKAEKVKTSWLTRKLFGLEGMLANKNFKRNRKKYRATVLSLFMSIVLFVSASSFCSYLSSSVNGAMDNTDYDLLYRADRIQANSAIQLLFPQLAILEGVTQSAWRRDASGNAVLSGRFLSERYVSANHLSDDGEEEQSVPVGVTVLDDAAFRACLRENGLDDNAYFDPEHPKFLAFDHISEFDYDAKRYENYSVLRSGDCTLTLQLIDYQAYYAGQEEQATEPERNLEDYYRNIPAAIGAVANPSAFGTADLRGRGLVLVLPWSMMDALLGEGSDGYFPEAKLMFEADDHRDVYGKMSDLLLESDSFSSGWLYDVAENFETNRNLITIVRVFSYGFITLISLIAVANVFNTVTTNLHLRRREFAMLRSVGMTKRGFHKMMNYECALYGIKALVLGLPVAFLFTYGIYQSVVSGWEMAFYVPWSSIAIAAFSVFAVVFVSMLYSMGKIKKENTVEALKNENL